MAKLGRLLPAGMAARLRSLEASLAQAKKAAARMVPDAVAEVHNRFKLFQRALYTGEWADVPGRLTSRTRVPEARLLEEGETLAKRAKGQAMDQPPNGIKDYWHMEGWPDLSTHLDPEDSHWVIRGFSGPMNAVHLPPGTKIYRVVEWGPKSRAAGQWWFRQLPADGRAWRDGYAVLESWSKNGAFVELLVPAGGLRVWEGKVASQIDLDKASETVGQYVPGGQSQLFIDFLHPSNAHALPAAEALPKRPTEYKRSDHIGVGVPRPRSVAVEKLGIEEVAPKTPAVNRISRGAVTTVRVSEIRSREEDEGP